MQRNSKNEPGDDTFVPETSRELLPTGLYKVEILLLPLFWLAPVMVLGLGGMMARDAGTLNEKFNAELSDVRYLLYLSPFTLSHASGFAYRAFRRKEILTSRGFEPSAASRLLKEEYHSTNYSLVGWLVLQVIVFIGLLIVPSSAETLLGAIGVALVLVWGLNLVVGPVLIWLDLRRIRSVESVEWGWTRYLHIMIGAVPFMIFFYLVQRIEHLYYAMLVDIWETPAEELHIEDTDKTRMERLGDRMDELSPF